MMQITTAALHKLAGCAIPSFLLEYNMKIKSLISTIIALMLSVSALSSMAATPVDLLGETAQAAAANRMITIAPDTKYVNVEGGQIVRFDIGGQTFTWDFDGPDSVWSFDLN